MLDTLLTLTTATGTRTVGLDGYLDPAAEERAHLDAYAWIKELRHLEVDGIPFRERFAVRDDSLWWFSEIYLHKMRAILDAYRIIAALRLLLDRERPTHVALVQGSVPTRHIASQLFAGARLGGATSVESSTWAGRLRTLDRQARRLQVLAGLAPDRFRRAPRHEAVSVAAFIHRAFWKNDGEDASAETYVGPVLHELESLAGPDRIQFVGVGPSTHFRAHRPWRRESSAAAVVPIERYASRRHLGAARDVWKHRDAWLAAMEQSSAFREHAVILGVDCWPIIREQLAGIAWLQWPWSVRSMDEAGAALDALQPRTILTYAEAGGWGRALILEARRRGIPSAGLQHGFIYRHWLNYLHEPDEMAADERTGFPRPTRTFVFDGYAAEHLRRCGRFPPGAVEVTGSPKLDALVESVGRLSGEAVEAIRRRLDVRGPLVLVATKEREARAHLPRLLEAVEALPEVTVVIKPHPAEDAQVYDALRQSRNVRVVAADESLAGLLAAARAVVTVNSTVALDAGVVGVPALSIGLPNNLSPFVEAGAIAGSASADELPQLLRRILYDDGFRQQLAAARELMVGHQIRQKGTAARRTADAILALAVDGRSSQQG